MNPFYAEILGAIESELDRQRQTFILSNHYDSVEKQRNFIETLLQLGGDGVIMRAFRFLARMRRLRGTWIDPFGYQHERREERQLLRDYEKLLDEVGNALTANNRDEAADLLNLADSIRGYGPVKAQSIEKMKADLPALKSAFTNSATRPQQAAE